jgi:hypothetical protein
MVGLELQVENRNISTVSKDDGAMEIKERWILVFFLLYFVLTFVLSNGGWKETFIERELTLTGPEQVIGMVQK